MLNVYCIKNIYMFNIYEHNMGISKFSRLYSSFVPAIHLFNTNSISVLKYNNIMANRKTNTNFPLTNDERAVENMEFWVRTIF